MKLISRAALSFFLFCFSALAHDVGRDHYCGIVSFRGGVVDVELLTSSIYTDKCDSWKKDLKSSSLLMPVRTRDATPESTEFIYISHATKNFSGSLPAFIEFHPKTRKFLLNDKIFFSLVESAPRYEINMGRMLAEGGSISVKLKCKTDQRAGGGYAACRVVYENEELKRKWVEGYYAYYSSRGLSARFWSSLMLFESLEDMAFLDKMDILFGSIRIGFD